MNVLESFYNTLVSRNHTILSIISIFAILGTTIVLGGGVWDSVSHALRIPETFWTIQHMTIYSGASIIALSSTMGTLISIKNKMLHRGILLILIGSIMQLGGGYADYNFHEVYGIDGLVTPSHLTVECGLLLTAFGGFITISKIKYDKMRLIIPISIMTLLLSASWIGFNLVLLIGNIEMCIPVYQLFSSGCAVA